MFLRYAGVLACSLTLLVAAPAAAGVYSDFVIDNTNPVIYWDQEETTGGTANDLAGTGGSNDGTYAANETHSVTLGSAGPRPSDGFLNMDATNAAPSVDYHGTTKHTSLTTGAGVSTTAYSVQMWFNSSVPFTDNALQYLLTRGNGTADSERRDAVYVGGNYASIVPNKLHIFTGIPGGAYEKTIGNRTLAKDTWYHMLYVRDGDDCKAYLNGKLEIQHTDAWGGGTGEYFTAGNRTDYDRFPASTGLGVHGNYDEVAVWDRAVDAGEAYQLYTQAFSPHPYPGAVLGDGPEAYWRLNETTGNNTAVDATGNGHDFTYHATPTRTGTSPDVGPRPDDFGGFDLDNNAPHLIGGPLDPADGYLGFVDGVLPGSPGGANNDYTAEMWIRLDEATLGVGGRYLLHRSDSDAPSSRGDFLGVKRGDVSGEVNLFVYNGGWPTTAADYVSIAGTADLLHDEWYHVGMTRDGDDVAVYLNGVLEIQGQMTPRSGTKWSDGGWAFGGRRVQYQQNQRFLGNLDEIAIYGQVLTQNEIQMHYLMAKIPEPTSVVLLMLGGLGLLAGRRRKR